MPAELATRVESPSGSSRQGGERRCPTCGTKYPRDFNVCPKDTTPLERAEGPDDDPLVGEILAGSFCVTGLVGSGGMGRVYEAEHVRLPRRFAVKVMHESLALHPEAVSRFEREAQAVARIEHENVVDIVDVVRARDNRPCIVTELLKGEELGEVLARRGKLPIETAIGLCRQVCRGLAAAHAAGVVHRDLKPSNLFLVERPDAAPLVKILDFGVAKLTDGAQLTHTGMVVGTPAYMAPEQARGSSDVDERADVYAVGAVLYRMLTGAAPFQEDDPAGALTRLLTEDPPRPRDLDRSIPEGLELLIQRAMARSPADRPATVLELDRLLAAFDPSETAARALAPAERAAIGVMDTALALGPLPPVEDAEDVTRRARMARPTAAFMVLAAGVCFGGAVLAVGSAGIRAIAGRERHTSTEILLLGILGGLAVIVAIAASMRALSDRWRNAPAVERVSGSIRSAILTLLASAGALAVAWRGVLATRDVPVEAVAGIELGIVAVPTLLALFVFATGMRKIR